MHRASSRNRMEILDNPQELKKLDSGNVIGSIESLPKQIEAAWNESKNIKLPDSFKDIKNIVVSGMGGSALGPHIIRSLFRPKIPFQIVNDYQLPSFVSQDTLVILSSYSGNTEETVTTGEEAARKTKKIIAISSGGKLIDLAKRENFPFYQFTTTYNPSNQPRMGLGYSIIGLLGILNSAGIVRLEDSKVQKIASLVGEESDRLNISNETENNPAKSIASSLSGFIPILVASGFLTGNVHVFANQINENAKCFSAYFLLPELNHHLIEGFTKPDKAKDILKFLFLDSDLYHPRIKRRSEVTKQILEKQKYEFISHKFASSDEISQVFEALSFSSWTSFYLAASYEIGPSPIPWVDFLKSELAKD